MFGFLVEGPPNLGTCGSRSGETEIFPSYVDLGLRTRRSSEDQTSLIPVRPGQSTISITVQRDGMAKSALAFPEPTRPLMKHPEFHSLALMRGSNAIVWLRQKWVNSTLRYATETFSEPLKAVAPAFWRCVRSHASGHWKPVSPALKAFSEWTQRPYLSSTAHRADKPPKSWQSGRRVVETGPHR